MMTLKGMSIRVLMIAPPGAGKGTQGALIAAHFDIPHIATGQPAGPEGLV
jgi:adenylate kinase family enzyme